MADALRESLQTALGGAYLLERELGGGGMSRVFVATDVRLGRSVVVKVLSPELAAGISAERFAREVRLAAKLQEPHIVPVLADGVIRDPSGGTHDGLPYYIMPFVRGASLRQRLASTPISAAEASSILHDVARALAYAHAQGVVHRDVKPENVLLHEGTAVVTDFGIAKAVSASRTQADIGLTGEYAGHTTGATGATLGLTQVGTSLGTPAYMAPEQAAGGSVDARADVYAWGVIAYELLGGAHPFASRTTAQQLVAAHMIETPEPLGRVAPSVPPALASLVTRCLDKDPARRPSTGGALLAELDAAITPPGGADARSAHARRRPVAALALGGLAVVAALAIGASVLRGRGAAREGGAGAPAAESRSIAVLPFTNVGGDSTTEYFADGMTDELASDLAKTRGLRVAARRSAYSFKGRNASPKDVGRALGVTLLLDGSVRRAGNRVRVTAQLTSASDAIVLWTDTFDGDASDVFAVQDTITRAIVGALRLSLGGGDAPAAPTVRTRSLAAHDLYLQGRFEAGKHTQTGLRTALTLFQRAAAVDSAYALPWVGMADAYGWLADDYFPAREAYPKAKAAAAHAVRLAPALADAHAALAWILLAYDWDVAGAEREAALAVALDSSSALAHSNHAYVLLSRRQPEAALTEMRRALALDPLSAALSANLEWHLLMQRRYAQVIEQHRVTRQIDPSYFFADSWVGIAHRELGRYDESVAAYRAAEALQDGRPLPGLAVTYARMGDSASARRQLARTIAFARTAYVRPEAVAQVYASLGERDAAFTWLERAYAARSNGLAELGFLPAYDPLRRDARFTALLRRVGLP